MTSPPIVRHSVRRANHQEVYLTLAQCDERLDAQFDAVAQALVEGGLEPISEKVFGSLAEQETIRSARAQAYTRRGLDPTRPFVLVEGASTMADAPLAGVQLWGVTVGDGQSVTTLRTDDGATRLWRSPGFELAWVCHCDRHLEEVSASPRGQARALLERAAALLAAHKMSFADVQRTWFYLAELLDWYPEFNRIRSRYFDEVGLRQDAAGPQLPASTGIQGRTGPAECALDLLAAHGDVRFTPIRSSARQGSAASYGSSFSRGAIMELCGEKTLFVSGTASIDGAGESVYLGDAEGQTLATLLAVAALLRERGLGWADVAQGTLYFKTPEAAEAWARVCEWLELPVLPLVQVFADICRPELLVELEVVAPFRR